MPGRHKHTATITRLPAVSETATRDAFGQRTTAGTSTTVWSGRGDYQDMSFRERRTIFGDEAVMSAGWFYPPLSCFQSTVRTDDRMTVTGDGVTVQGVIIDVDRLSRRVLLKVEKQPVTA